MSEAIAESVPSDGAFQTNGSNAELDAFKIQVATVARELAKDHGLCEVVDNALDKMGIGIAKKQVAVTMGVSGQLVFDVDELVWDHLDDEARQKWIKDRTDVVVSGGSIQIRVSAAGGAGMRADRGWEHLNFTRNDIAITEISEELPPEPTLDERYQWWRLPHGNVLHAIHYTQQNVNGYISPACGRVQERDSHWVKEGPGVDLRPKCRFCERAMEAVR